MTRNRMCTIGIIWNAGLLVYFFCYISVFAVTQHIPQSMNVALIGATAMGVMIPFYLLLQQVYTYYVQKYGYDKQKSYSRSIYSKVSSSHLPSTQQGIPIIGEANDVIQPQNCPRDTQNQTSRAKEFLHVLTFFPKICIRVYRLLRRCQPKVNDTLFTALLTSRDIITLSYILVLYNGVKRVCI